MNSQSNSDLKTPGLKNNETLSVVKKARKQAEEDARLLTNRIALLKQEELRTIKKINETTKKAMEIYKIKEQNEKRWFQRNRELQSIKSHKRDMYINHTEEIKEQHELRKKKINEVFEYKKKQTDETKKMLEEQRAYRESCLNQIAEVNHNRFKNIKKQRIEGKQKINQFINQRKEFLRSENEREMIKQEKVKKEKIEEISKLEQAEMTLIEKLRNTQQVQVKAYEKLEAAISLPPQEFKKRYEDEIVPPIETKKKPLSEHNKTTEIVNKENEENKEK